MNPRQAREIYFDLPRPNIHLIFVRRRPVRRCGVTRLDVAVARSLHMRMILSGAYKRRRP